MAGRAFFDDPNLVPFPRGYLVDLCMAVFALDIIDEMSACIMFCPFLLMASMAGDRLRMNSPPFGFHMSIDVRDIPVATIAGIGSVNGLGEFSLTDFGMATETFGIVDALIAIFAAPDDKPLALFCNFRRLGDLCRLGPLFFRSGLSCPRHFRNKKEKNKKDEKNEG
jgi:hypothetical protein